MVKDFLKDEGGQSVIEYSLLMALIGASVVVMLTWLGISVSRAVGISDLTVERYTEWAFRESKSR